MRNPKKSRQVLRDQLDMKLSIKEGKLEVKASVRPWVLILLALGVWSYFYTR